MLLMASAGGNASKRVELPSRRIRRPHLNPSCPAAPASGLCTLESCFGENFGRLLFASICAGTGPNCDCKDSVDLCSKWDVRLTRPKAKKWSLVEELLGKLSLLHVCGGDDRLKFVPLSGQHYVHYSPTSHFVCFDAASLEVVQELVQYFSFVKSSSC